MKPTPKQLLKEDNAVVEYLKRYSLSKEDFIALLWKCKEITLEDATKMVDLYIERYPEVKEYFSKSKGLEIKQ